MDINDNFSITSSSPLYTQASQALLNTSVRSFKMVENYIYLYHLKQFVVIPTFADQLQDTMSVTFQQSSPMSRSAPIYSYSHSGPRTVQIGLNLHRDMMTLINKDVSNISVNMGDDYVDTMLAQLQAAAVPAYNSSQKLVDPPQVAVRFGTDFFIKGVVNGQVAIGYQIPILENGKYAIVNVSFTVSEVDPYSAQQIAKIGSWRGFDGSLEKRLFNAPTTNSMSRSAPTLQYGNSRRS